MSDDNGEVRTISIGSRHFRLPYEGCCRPLTAAERDRLKKSVKRYGIQDQVAISEYDDVIDGQHRLEIAVELRIPVEDIPFDRKVGLSKAQEKALAVELNEGRRQLTPEEMEAAAEARKGRVQAKKAEGKSERQIAAEEGVSKTQVHRDLEDRTGPPGPVEVKGRDGKTRTYDAKPKPPKPLKKRGGEEDEEDDGRVCDCLGNVAPTKHLEDVFSDALLGSVGKTISDLVKQLKSAARWAKFVRLENAVAGLESARDAVACGLPYAVHLACEGKGCEECRQAGYVPKWRHEELDKQGAA